MRHARAKGAEYILFDADAPPNNALPVFEEAGWTLRCSNDTLHPEARTPRQASPFQEAAMADYFCQFSCMFDVGTAENAISAIEIQRQQAVALFDEEGSDLGFDVQHDPETGPGALWISSDEYGEPEHVIGFVLACAGALDLRGRWGFRWALTCSRPRLDGFGGGAQVIDLGARKSVGWIDCEHWLVGALDPESDAETGIVQWAATGGERVVGAGAHSSED